MWFGYCDRVGTKVAITDLRTSFLECVVKPAHISSTISGICPGRRKKAARMT